MASTIVLRGFFLLVLSNLSVLSIQNDPTFTRSSNEETILSGSAYTGPEKTFSHDQRDEVVNFRTSKPTINLESSRNVETVEKQNEPFAFKVTSPEEPIDSLTSSKHVEHFEGNNIEVKPGEYYRIMPTKSETISGEGEGAPQGQDPSSEPRIRFTGSQEGARRGRQEIPRIYKENSTPILQTVSPGTNRQANPDIQDIITGIVKLLNGNVNVVANTVRPHKPVQATRINNRGPPRISDLPPLPPDFDTPGMNPPPPPAPERPYPFEKPPAPERPSINQLPPERPLRPFINGEGIVSQGNRPWNRPYRPGTRRPILSYKPLPVPELSNHDSESTEGDKPSRPSVLDGEKSTTEKVDEKPEKLDETTKKPQKYRPPLKEEKINGENTLILGSNPRPIPIPNNEPDEDEKPSGYPGMGLKPNQGIPGYSGTLEITQNRETLHPSEENNMSSTETASTKTKKISSARTSFTTLNIETSSSVQVIEPTKTSTEVRPTLDKSKNEENQKKVNKYDHDGSSSGQNSDDSHPNKTEHQKIENKDAQSHDTDSVDPQGHQSNSEDHKTLNSDIEGQRIQNNGSQGHQIENKTSGSLQGDHVHLEPSRIPFEDFTKSATSTESLATRFSGHVTTKINNLQNSRPIETTSKTQIPTERYSYRPRPGIVLDDTLDYTRGGGLATQRPYAPPRHPQIGDIFDVTVSAVQGPGGGSGESVRVPVNVGNSDVILTSAVEGQGFVSIDGKRTYLNLFDNTDHASTPTSIPHIQPTRTQAPPIVGTGYAIPQPDIPVSSPRPSAPPRRPTFHRRPPQPPVRIDTCIVGDTSTCDASQHEACATVQGVSACHCKPGYARLLHSLPCKRVVSIVVSIRVDRMYELKVVWDQALADKDSDSYQTLAYEANRAIESAMSMTPFSDEYMGSSINGVYQGDVSQGQGGVFVNATLKLTYEPRTARPSLAGELQRHLLGVIHRRNNNIGNSAIYVDSPPGSISNLQDLDECASSELNDCHSSAKCSNTWGGFVCSCAPGLKDPQKDDPNEAGRNCLSCPSSHCNNRGTCSYQANQMQCTCTGNYYGAQCEVDGEVLGVAIGASVAALIIIVLTLVCLVMWSRRWSREQKAVGSPVYGYMQGGIPGTLPGTLARVGSVGTLASVKQGPPTNLPPYMWAHISDHMATANVYATEPMGPTRPSSAVFGYPTMSAHGTLRPVPLPRLQAPPRPRQRHNQPEPDSSDSEPQDKDRADLIPQNSGFHVPRPKSRSSLANQSGIYYDVEYDQGDAQHLSKNNIPMSTYSMARPYYRT